MADYGNTFLESITASAESIRTTLGFDAVYTPAAGDPESFKCSFESELQFQPGSLEAQVWGNKFIIEYLRSDLTKEPNKGESITVLGTSYTVDSIENPNTDILFARVVVYA